MMKTIQAGLAMTFATLSFVGCTSEEAMSHSSQVDYQDVNISFFDATLEQMGVARTRADDTPLKDCFQRLDVALFSVNDATVKYTATQTSGDESFGTVSMRVPTGDYTLVGVAHKGRLEETPSATIESTENVTFPKSIIGDVAYVTKSLTVNTVSQTAACSMKRAVALFRIKCQDAVPDKAKKVNFTFDKNCGFRFNPSTGLRSNETSVDFSFTVNKTEDEEKTDKVFEVYLFLANQTTTTNVTVTITDSDNKVLNKMQFDDVTLQVNHVTTYTGQLFTAGGNMTFTFSDTEMSASGYDKEF